MARRRKKPRVKPSATREEQQGEENQQDDEEEDIALPRRPQRLTQLTKNDITFNNDKVREDSQDSDNRQVFNKTDEEYEKELAFCCFTCACPPKMKRKIPADDPYFQSVSQFILKGERVIVFHLRLICICIYREMVDFFTVGVVTAGARKHRKKRL